MRSVLITITHVGTATTILDIAGVLLLTDPTFDPAGTRYKWAPIGASSTKLEQPALPVEQIGRLDAARRLGVDGGGRLDRPPAAHHRDAGSPWPAP